MVPKQNQNIPKHSKPPETFQNAPKHLKNTPKRPKRNLGVQKCPKTSLDIPKGPLPWMMDQMGLPYGSLNINWAILGESPYPPDSLPHPWPKQTDQSSA